jgi:hypothetical protein
MIARAWGATADDKIESLNNTCAIVVASGLETYLAPALPARATLSTLFM